MTSLMIKGLQMDVERLQSRLSASEAMCEKMRALLVELLDEIPSTDLVREGFYTYKSTNKTHHKIKQALIAYEQEK